MNPAQPKAPNVLWTRSPVPIRLRSSEVHRHQLSEPFVGRRGQKRFSTSRCCKRRALGAVGRDKSLPLSSERTFFLPTALRARGGLYAACCEDGKGRAQSLYRLSCSSTFLYKLMPALCGRRQARSVAFASGELTPKRAKACRKKRLQKSYG